jgi:Domain of unknown function (DU1801)
MHKNMPKNDNFKTIVSNDSILDFLNNYPNQKIVPDCLKLIKIFEQISSQKAKMWGNMIGFGSYHYKYPSGREGDYFKIGFAPSKVGITIYNSAQYLDQVKNLEKLGKFTTGKSCLYIKSLDDINIVVLQEILTLAYQI